MTQFSNQDGQNNQNNYQYQQNGYQQQQFQPQFQQQFQPHYQPPKTNGKAIATLVLGILSLVLFYVGFVPGVVGIILGAISLKEIKKSGDQGRGLAIAGLVCSIIGTLLWGIILLAIVAVFIFAAAEGSSSYSNYSSFY
ncbi:DUF4190 domain-containing protein [Paenibacillus sp. GCM10027627]|uniref:DUF4190 domain-containing protein n=1 Tax=unclassified Paenibacillus TaxID=185978 RepID=UPI00362F279F